jgi:hypothetical protein
MLSGTLIERNFHVGVSLLSSQATVAGSVIRGTQPEVAMNLYGDGLAVVHGTVPSSALIENTHIHDNLRAGLANFSSQVTLRGTHLTCNGFDLAGQQSMAPQFVFQSEGENVCGCPQPEATCKAITSDLGAPEALPPDD